MRRQSISSSRVTERQRHRFRPLRAGAEHQERDGVFAGGFLALLEFGRIIGLRRLRGAAERLRDAIRVDDHDDRAVAENGGAGKHRDMPQLRRHRLDHDLLGVQHAVDHRAENLIADLDDRRQSRLSRSPSPSRRTSFRCRSGNSLLRSRNTGVSLIRSMRCSPPPPARTSSSTESCGMAKRSPAGLDDERRDDRERQRNLDGESRSAAGNGLQVDRAADLLDIAAHDVHADAAAGNAGHLRGGGKAGREDEIADFAVGFARHIGFAGKPDLDGLGLDARGIEAAAVIGDLDDDVAALVAGGKPDRSALRLAGGNPLRAEFSMP